MEQGVDTTSYGSVFSSVLLNKLPSDLRLIVSRKVKESDCNLDSLLKLMEEEIVARERVEPKPIQPPQRRSSERGPSTMTALVMSINPSSPTCCYCQQPHSPNSCTTVTQTEARKKILKKSGCCFCCLKRGHISRECRSPHKCLECTGRHHISICPRSHSSDSNQLTTGCSASQLTHSGVPEVSHITKPGLNPDAATFVVPTTFVTMCAGVDKTELLQTAQATIYNPSRPQRVQAILDNGSR